MEGCMARQEVEELQNEADVLEGWLNRNLQYEFLKICLEKAVSFYGGYCKKLLLESDLVLLLNDKKQRNSLGRFNAFSREITLFKVKDSLNKNILDCVFVHELAHFIDSERRGSYSRYRFASSQSGRKERIIAELFRSKMSPVPQKRTNYRGRTCELFARAMEEFYAIHSGNEKWMEEFLLNDNYVDSAVFQKEISPVVSDYINQLSSRR